MNCERLENSLGSGVIVRPDGLIVTSNHVGQRGGETGSCWSDRREFDAKLVWGLTNMPILPYCASKPRTTICPFMELKDLTKAGGGFGSGGRQSVRRWADCDDGHHFGNYASFHRFQRP